jgi:hypothetical protein
MVKKYASRNTKTQKIALAGIYALALFVLLWSYFALVTLLITTYKTSKMSIVWPQNIYNLSFKPAFKKMKGDIFSK